MLRFDIITIFPHIFDSFLKESFIKKAQDRGLIQIKIHDLRGFTSDRHQSVDDRPFGGGFGMVLKVEPIFKAVNSLRKSNSKNRESKVIFFTPRGKKFNQKIGYDFSKLKKIIMICGRYEGVDERVAKNIADTELSIGDYDLMGGELPAMVVMETVTRLIPGVLGKPELLKERITKSKGFVELPQYTRPEIFSTRLRQGHSTLRVSGSMSSGGQVKKGISWKVPKVLLSGDHKKIEDWRMKHGKVIEKQD